MNRQKDRRGDAAHGAAPARATADSAAAAAAAADRRAAASSSFAVTVARLYVRSGLNERMRLLKALLPAVRPLALTVIGAGVFARYLSRARWEDVPVSVEDAAGFSAAQVMDLALYVEQSHPGWVEQVTSVLSQNPATLQAAGAVLVALAVGAFVERRGTPQDSAEAD